MEARPASHAPWNGRVDWLGPSLVLALGALAYRPLLSSAIQLRTGTQIEHWMFRPSSLPTTLVMLVAGWLLWRRRERLLASAAHRQPVTTAVLAALGASIFAWALLTRTVDLFLPSLAVNLLAFGSAARGRPGCRVVVLPSLVLLLGVRLPAPLQHEIVWRLQLWTAAGAAWLLDHAGREFVLGGVLLGDGEHTFQVIEACSGFQGIQILILVALMVRELFAATGRRQWLLVALVPWLGYALNVLRIAYIAASPDPQALVGLGGDHTPQGVAVLAAGTGFLYALAWAIGRPHRSSSESARAPKAARAMPWWLPVGWLVGLAVLRLLLSPFPPSEAAAARPKVRFPEGRAGWSSERLFPDPWFIGSAPTSFYRRYERHAEGRAPQVVELFIGLEVEGLAETSRLFSSKLTRPGPEWNLERTRHSRIWVLGSNAELSVASRRPAFEHAVVYTWRLRDDGIRRESWRSFWSLASSPFRRPEPRAVVRLVAFAPHGDPLAIDRAKQRLDRFITTFREDLAAL
jgi:exosortase